MGDIEIGQSIAVHIPQGDTHACLGSPMPLYATPRWSASSEMYHLGD